MFSGRLYNSDPAIRQNVFNYRNRFDCMVHALERQPKKSDPEKPKPSELDHKVRLLVKPVTKSPEADEDLQVAQGPEFLSGL